MITKIQSKRIVFPDGMRGGSVYLKDGKILQIDGDLSADMCYDFGEDIVIPGLADIHTHGAKGFDFANTTTEGFCNATKYHLSRGATAIMPTITSSSFEETWKALACAEQAIPQCPNVVGIHLEGPYLSPQQCGAQSKTHITAPIRADYEKIIKRFGHIIRRWDYAPERDENNEFCKCLVANDILPAAAHTDAIFDDMESSLKEGCRLITHLYSCTSTITRDKGFRRLGVIECAYLMDDMHIEIIADGKHLPPELLKLIFKMKPLDKIIAVSDSLSIAGSDQTEGFVGEVPFIVEDGICKLADRSAFAGSIISAQDFLQVLTEKAGLSLENAIRVSSENPCRLFGLNKGKIEQGYDADLVVLDNNNQIKNVFCNGTIVS